MEVNFWLSGVGISRYLKFLGFYYKVVDILHKYGTRSPAALEKDIYVFFMFLLNYFITLALIQMLGTPVLGLSLAHRILGVKTTLYI